MSTAPIAQGPVDVNVRGWISTTQTLPDKETPVLIFYRGNIVIGERRWECPTFEESFEPFWYWDDPTDDGKDWGRDEVTYWRPLPKAPNVK